MLKIERVKFVTKGKIDSFRKKTTRKNMFLLMWLMRGRRWGFDGQEWHKSKSNYNSRNLHVSTYRRLHRRFFVLLLQNSGLIIDSHADFRCHNQIIKNADRMEKFLFDYCEGENKHREFARCRDKFMWFASSTIVKIRWFGIKSIDWVCYRHIHLMLRLRNTFTSWRASPSSHFQFYYSLLFRLCLRTIDGISTAC